MIGTTLYWMRAIRSGTQMPESPLPVNRYYLKYLHNKADYFVKIYFNFDMLKMNTRFLFVLYLSSYLFPFSFAQRYLITLVITLYSLLLSSFALLTGSSSQALPCRII